MSLVSTATDQGRFTAHLRVERFSVGDIEEAVREGVLRPKVGTLGLFLPKARKIERRVQLATRDEMVAVGLDPFSVSEVEDNLEVYTGINAMLNLLIGTSGSSPTTYAHGNARLCVGDGGGSVPTPAATDTDLTATTGATHRYMNAADVGYPSVPNGGNNLASSVLTVQATVAAGNGNFEWREWGMDSGGSSGTGAASGLFNHRGVDLGGKTSAAAWALQVTFTQS